MVDFGFAIKYEDISLTNTEIPFCVGTPGYVAPEMMRGQQYDSRADVFSAGSMLYLMLTYHPAFAASTKEEIIEKNRACEPEWRFCMLPTEPKDHPSKETMELLKSMMAKDPTVRIRAHQALKHKAFDKLKDPVKEVKKKPEVKRKQIGTEFTPNDIPSDEGIKAITEFESSQIFEEKPFPQDIIPVISLDKERDGEIKFWGGASFKQTEKTDAATRTRDFMQRAYSPLKDRSKPVPLQKKSTFLKNNFQMPPTPLVQLPKKVFTFGAEENSNRELGNDTPYNLEPRLYHFSPLKPQWQILRISPHEQPNPSDPRGRSTPRKDPRRRLKNVPSRYQPQTRPIHAPPTEIVSPSPSPFPPSLPYVIFEERLNGKFSEIAVEFNLSGGRANLSNPTNFSDNLPDSPNSTRFRKF